jgi:hypothetical protein
MSCPASVVGGFESGERFIRLPPSISASSPSAAPLAEAIGRLAGYAHNYPGLRQFAAGVQVNGAVGALNIRSRHLADLPTLTRRCRLKWTVLQQSETLKSTRRSRASLASSRPVPISVSLEPTPVAFSLPESRGELFCSRSLMN